MESILFKDCVDINDNIKIVIPTVGEVLEEEESYYGAVSLLTSMPVDMIATLDEIGVDFTEINEFDLFLLLFDGLKTMDTHLIFKDLDLSKFKRGVNTQNGLEVVFNPETGVVIDKLIHEEIANVIRKINHLEKNRKKPANKEAKEFMIKRAKRKKKQNSKAKGSQLEPLIISLVNTEQFKYNFETVKNISIYQFNESFLQIVKKVNYDNRMVGVYMGTVPVKDLKPDELTWLAKT